MKPRPFFLIVEDSPWDAEFTVRWLQPRFGHTTLVCVATEAEAYRAGAERTFAAVFVNLKLGHNRFAGLQVIEWFRERFADVPVFVVSGADDERSRELANRAGAAGFFSKDFNSRDVAAVENVIQLRLAALEKGKTMKHKWTTIGGTVTNIGSALIGLAIVPGSTSMTAAEDMKWVLIAGFVLQIVGQQISSGSAADAKVVNEHLDRCPK
jgi:DNA-binding response OmpR family regulator